VSCVIEVHPIAQVEFPILAPRLGVEVNEGYSVVMAFDDRLTHRGAGVVAGIVLSYTITYQRVTLCDLIDDRLAHVIV